MRAVDLMTKNPTVVTELATVDEAIDIFYAEDIRHLPVVRGEELVGILSDRDVRKFKESIPDDESLTATQGPTSPSVSAVMNTSPVRVDPETPAKDIVELMTLHRVGALPVVDENTNALLGIVSYVDLLRLLQEMLD